MTNNELKLIKSLKMQKARKENKLFVAEGNKVVYELLSNEKYKLQYLLYTLEWYNANPDFEYLDNAEQITAKQMVIISSMKNPSGILAVFEMAEQEEVAVFDNNIILALDNIKDPGNLGTIIRLANWFGIKNIICSNESVEVYNPKVIQASMGAIVAVNVCYTDLGNWLDSQENTTNIYGAFLNGDNIYNEELKKGIIVMGSESHGISKSIEKHINKKITIPRFSDNVKGTESLNAAIATAIVLSEFSKII